MLTYTIICAVAVVLAFGFATSCYFDVKREQRRNAKLVAEFETLRLEHHHKDVNAVTALRRALDDNAQLGLDLINERKRRRQVESHAEIQVNTIDRQSKTIVNMTRTHELLLGEIERLTFDHAQQLLFDIATVVTDTGETLQVRHV